MTDANSTQIPQLPAPEQPAPETAAPASSQAKTWLIVAAVAILALLITGLVFLIRADNPTTTRVRDIFIIFMALESLVIGVALVILVVQLATLINLIQNEIKPILTNTQETVNNLKGTTAFLSDQLVEPVIKLNSYMAGLKRLLDILRPGGR